VDLEHMSRYLQPSADKLASKGVASIRSRVANLMEFAPHLSVDILRQYLIESLGEVYEGNPCLLGLSAADKGDVEELARKYADWQWICGKHADFDIELTNRFAWGGVSFNLRIINGSIEDALIYSDALEAELIISIAEKTKHCRYQSQELISRIKSVTAADEKEKQIICDICQWLTTLF
jgi:lipoate---protein ligase